VYLLTKDKVVAFLIFFRVSLGNDQTNIEFAYSLT